MNFTLFTLYFTLYTLIYPKALPLNLELIVVDISLYSHLDATGECLEDSLNLVVLVVTLSFDVKVHLSSIANALEEMEEHLSRHLANLLPVKLSIPYQPRATSEIECYLTETVIHRKGIAVTLYATLIAKSF